LAESLAAISPALGFTLRAGTGAGAFPDGACGFAARLTLAFGSGLAGTLARAFFATGMGALASASDLGVPLIVGFFIDRGDAVRAVCFTTGVLAGRVVFTARFAGLPVALFALWVAFAPRFQAGLTQPEAITFEAPLAWAFAEVLLTDWESIFTIVVLPSSGAILAVCLTHDPSRFAIGAWLALRAACLTFSLVSMPQACGSATSGTGTPQSPARNAQMCPRDVL
jgi:hypothetical protein